MNITGRKRILFVEDTEGLRKNLIADIRSEVPELEIDEAASKESAFTSIRNRTYHLAILDIMLTQEKSNRDGLHVLDKLREMNEGTLAIMLSGTPDIDCAIHALRSRIVVDYVHKEELRRQTAPLVRPIRAGLNEAHVPVFGKFGRLTAYLASPEDTAAWEYNAIRTVTSAGFDPLNHAFNAVFRDITPALCLKKNKTEGVPALTLDANQKAVHGTFWSKALGHAVAVCIWSPSGQAVVPENATDRHDVSDKGGKHLNGTIWRLPAGRDEFIESVWEV